MEGAEQTETWWQSRSDYDLIWYVQIFRGTTFKKPEKL
jgi:hypothetical protein